MELDLNSFEEWEIAQQVTVKFLKNLIEDRQQDWTSEEELKAYLQVLSDNMWIKDFQKYAKEKYLDKYCETIYEKYDLD